MIQAQLLDDDGVLIVEPKAALTARDFAGLAAVADPYIEAHGQLNGLLIHADDFPGWEDFAGLASHVRFVRDHHRQVAKIAAVSDSRFLKVAPKLASHFVQAEIKHFPADDYDAALAWLREAG